MIDKANLWSNADVQLLQIANAIEVIKWQIGNQGRKRAKASPPKPFIPKELKDLTARIKRNETAKKQDLELHTIDEMKELLSRPRK